MATLYGDQHFESLLYFENVTAKELKTKYDISGINMNKWYQSALRVRDKPQQFITGNWSARILTVNSGPTLPSYMTGPRKPNHFGALLRNAREDTDYMDLCDKFRAILKSQQKRVYHLKYLERGFELDMSTISTHPKAENHTIRAAFTLEKASDNYLLINTGERTHVLKWNAQASNYKSLVDFNVGQVDQAIALEVGNTTTIASTIDFVTNNAGVGGTLNYWRLTDNQLSLLETFEKPATDLWFSTHARTKLYAVHNNTLYDYSLSERAHTSTWLLPDWLGNDSFRFVPHHSQALMLSNGEVIMIYSDDTEAADDADEDALNGRDKRTTLPRYSLPLYYQRVLSPQSIKLSEAVLKPNVSEPHIYRFADFRNVILQVLNDLDYRLRLEVNITQLSIPETDLHDEHLVQDFIAIMQALREQKIYPNASFEQIEWQVQDFPENPAQILAARTVQILWPNIVDMAEIQGYLVTNADETDMTVATIIDNLGTTVRDVLILANSKEQVEELIDDYTMAAHAFELSLVIERVRALQRYLKNTARTLKMQLLEEAASTTTAIPSDDENEIFASAISAANERVERANETPLNLSELLIAHGTWLIFHSKILPTQSKGEILPITVLTQQTPLELLAVTLPAPQLVGAQQAQIALYLDILSGTRFQTINADQPRSLITLQIVSETLLAYVEDCCTVRLLVYRGVQGFVEFTRFKSAEKVLKIFAVTLQGSEGLVAQPHLAVAHAKRVVFYSFVGAGAILRVPSNFICF